jgi:hypothetical protein
MTRIILSTLACSAFTGVTLVTLYLGCRGELKSPKVRKPMSARDPRFWLGVVWCLVTPKPRHRYAGKRRGGIARHGLSESA